MKNLTRCAFCVFFEPRMAITIASGRWKSLHFVSLFFIVYRLFEGPFTQSLFCLPHTPRKQVLINYYRDGSDTVGWHADDEKLYGDTPTIASLSLGSARDFFLRKIADQSDKYK